MSFLRRIAEVLGAPPARVPNPPSAISLKASRMHEAAARAGNALIWNSHRLIQAGEDRAWQVDGRWPLLTSVNYREEGEGGRPTVYISLEGDGGVWPVHPLDFIVLLPPPK